MNTIINKCCKKRNEMVAYALLGKNEKHMFANVPREIKEKWLDCVKVEGFNCSECEDLLDEIRNREIKQQYSNCCGFRKEVLVEHCFNKEEINHDEAQQLFDQLSILPNSEWIGLKLQLETWLRTFRNDLEECSDCQNVLFLASNLIKKDNTTWRR